MKIEETIDSDIIDIPLLKGKDKQLVELVIVKLFNKVRDELSSLESKKADGRIYYTFKDAKSALKFHKLNQTKAGLMQFFWLNRVFNDTHEDWNVSKEKIIKEFESWNEWVLCVEEDSEWYSRETIFKEIPEELLKKPQASALENYSAPLELSLQRVEEPTEENQPQKSATEYEGPQKITVQPIEPSLAQQFHEEKQPGQEIPLKWKNIVKDKLLSGMSISKVSLETGISYGAVWNIAQQIKKKTGEE